MYIFQMIDGLTVGGAEHLQVVFAKEAKTRGIKLAVISLENDDGSPYLNELRALGTAIYFFPTKRIFDINNLYKLVMLMLKERPDVLHTHLTYSIIIGSLAARIISIPVVATLHSTGVDERLRARRTEQVEIFTLSYLVNKVIACGPAVARYYKKNYKKISSLIIPNAVEDIPTIRFAKIDALRRQIIGDVERPLIISVGRLEKYKGYLDLIEAFNILHTSHPTAFLAIVGDGHMKNTLEEMIREFDLSDHIKLLGQRTDVPDLLRASDIYVLASHWEGLPLALLESMAAGLPALVTDVGDNAWAIGSAGLVVPPHQPKSLALALSKLLDDPAYSRTLGLVARSRFEENFKPSIWFDNIISVYQSLLD